jgi:hypothetical protein
MAARISIQMQPDQPRPFGYKIAWLALRTTAADAVASALGMTESRIATWVEGIAAAYDPSSVFVTPPLAGWTLATGVSLFSPDTVEAFAKPLLARLSRAFGDAQYFCTHRVVEAHIWARAVEGRLVRGYGWVGDQGVTLWDEGMQTQEERDLGFGFFDERCSEVGQRDYWTRKDLTFPNENCVMRLAGRWSIDPSTLDEKFTEPGLGVLGEFTHSGR